MKKIIAELQKELLANELSIGDFELIELLHLHDDHLDFPIATGKKIILEELKITGVKNDGNRIDFVQKFNSGINMIIADNLKGKSSIFKAVKFALTGRDSLKPDVSSWIKTIILCFSISDKRYTICIDKSASRMSGALYSTVIDQVSSTYNENILFESKTKKDYESQIQKFFFNQFSYYPLSWTQKASAKDSIELNQSNASWSTYFKSIYLESKDTNSFYGNQGSKTFQVLLGLKYTKIINKLMIDRDFIQNSLAKIDANNISLNEGEDLSSEFAEIEAGLDDIRKNANYIRLRALREAQDGLFVQINDSSKTFNANNNHHYKLLIELDKKQTTYDELVREKDALEREITKLIRKINDINEYLESGHFFSNLTIKMCPSCNHEIEMLPISDEHQCLLCHKPVSSELENKEQFSERLRQLDVAKLTLENKINEVAGKISVFNKDINNIKDEKIRVENDIKNNNYSELSQKAEDIAEQLDKLNDTLTYTKDKENDLIARKAVLEYRFKMRNTGDGENVDSIKDTFNILEKSIDYFINKRFNECQPILRDLESLMLNEIHIFGLPSISAIHIDKYFNIEYTQNETRIKFEDIAEGEQLRVKLSFYLSLIQLDIQKNYGKHTRLLIIDSPAKEEGDNKYLAGLKTVLEDIETRYSDKLQILIGTAERSLVNVVKNQKIYRADEYVF